MCWLMLSYFNSTYLVPMECAQIDIQKNLIFLRIYLLLLGNINMANTDMIKKQPIFI